MAWSSGPQNIRENIRVILTTQKKERLMLPDFGAGLSAYLFEPNIVATHRLMQERIAQALARWEPRIRVESVTVEPDPAHDDEESALVTIAYKLVATGTAERMSVSIQLTT
jgi:phage baseplate assembly protein W